MAPNLPVQSAAVDRGTSLDPYYITKAVRNKSGAVVELKKDQPGGAFGSLPGDPAAFSITRARTTHRFAALRRGPA